MVRVLLFNATGERDCAAILKLLVVRLFLVALVVNLIDIVKCLLYRRS